MAFKPHRELEKALKELRPPPRQRVNGIKTSLFDFKKVTLTSAAVALAPSKFYHLLLVQMLVSSENFNKIHPYVSEEYPICVSLR